MANLPISGLTAGSAVSGTDLFPDVQVVGVGPVRVTGDQIKTFCNAAPTIINPVVLNTLTVGAQSSSQGSIVLANTASGPESLTLQSSNSMTAAWTLTFPVTPGTLNQALLTDGTGVTSWGEPPVTTLQGGIASQIPYQSAPNTTSFIPNGTAGQFLKSNGTAAPAWSTVNLASSASVTGILPIANGGTDLSTVGTNGQALISNGTALLYGNPAIATNIAGGVANNVPYQTAASTTAFVTNGVAGNSLITAVGGAPTWGSVNLADNTNAVTGTLPIANGGTGLATVGASGTVPISNGTSLAYGVPNANLANAIKGGAASQILYQSAVDTTSFIPNGTPGQYLTSNGTIAPSWQTPALSSYHISVNSGGTIAAAILAAGITDAAGNFYTFVNSSTSNVVLTASIVDQSAAYPTSVTGTSVTLAAGGTIGVNTITAGSEYSIDVVSPISGLTTINVTGNVTLTASTSVDRYGVIQLSPTGSGYTVNIPAPTNTLAGRQILVCNNQPYSLTVSPLNGSAFTLTPATSVTLIWNGGSWYGTTPINSGSYARAYSFSSSANINFLSMIGAVQDKDGNVYTLQNTNATSGITITFPATSNPTFLNQSSMSSATHTSNNTIYLRPFESITLQCFVAANSTYYYITTTQPQDFTCRATMGSMGAPPQNTDTTLNFVTNGSAPGHDPMGAFNSTTHTWTCPRAGQWIVSLSLNITSTNSPPTLYNVQIRVNNDNSKGIYAYGYAPGTSTFGGGQSSGSWQTLITANVGDTVIATIYPYAGSSVLTPANNSSTCQLNFSLVG